MKKLFIFGASVFFQWTITISILLSCLYFFELNRMILSYMLNELFSNDIITIFTLLVTVFTVYAVIEIYSIIFKGNEI